MNLSEDDIEDAYEFLRHRHPYNKWDLPLPLKIRFKVTHSRMSMGEYDVDPHKIMVSCRQIHNYTELLETVAHEMVHLACEIKDHCFHPEHDKNFKRLARQVCTAFGWKLETF